MYLLIRTESETPWITEAVRRIVRQMASAQAIAWAASKRSDGKQNRSVGEIAERLTVLPS